MVGARKMAVKRYVVIASVVPIQFVISPAGPVRRMKNAMLMANASAYPSVASVSAGWIQSVRRLVVIARLIMNAMLMANASVSPNVATASVEMIQFVTNPVAAHVKLVRNVMTKANASACLSVVTANAGLSPYAIRRVESVRHMKDAMSSGYASACLSVATVSAAMTRFVINPVATLANLMRGAIRTANVNATPNANTEIAALILFVLPAVAHVPLMPPAMKMVGASPSFLVALMAFV